MRKLNVIGSKCPLPILKLTKELSSMQSGEKVELSADDQSTINDIPNFIKKTGHKIDSIIQENGIIIFVIEKK